MAAPAQPMLASIGEAPLDDARFVYEPKYDGIRAIVEVAPGGAARLWSRNGNEKTAQFPEIVEAFAAWGRRRRTGLVLDGEVVALDAKGRPTSFGALQPRIHRARADASAAAVPSAFIAFDLLGSGSINSVSGASYRGYGTEDTPL